MKRTLVPALIATAWLGLSAQSPAGHSTHPDAQWFPDAALGLFLHWDEASVKGLNIGWSVIPGRPIAARKDPFSADEVQRIVRDNDYQLDGTRWPVTPNQYWALAKDFDPTQSDPDKWLRAAKAAGFEYAVLTTKGGRDLLRQYPEGVRGDGQGADRRAAHQLRQDRRDLVRREARRSEPGDAHDRRAHSSASATRYLFALPKFKGNSAYEKDLLPCGGRDADAARSRASRRSFAVPLRSGIL